MGTANYSHYGTPDVVAERWAHAIEMHREWVAHCFKDYRDGLIDVETLERRCTTHALGPINDRTFAEAKKWAEAEAERLNQIYHTSVRAKVD